LSKAIVEAITETAAMRYEAVAGGSRFTKSRDGPKRVGRFPTDWELVGKLGVRSEE
jgi:hypothetical protein